MQTITINNNKQSINKVSIGKNVKIYDFVNAYGCTIGDNSKIGAFVEIQKGVTIGKNCKISSHTFICEGVHISDNVFVGHNVSFINDKFPSSVDKKGNLQTEDDWKVIETIVEDNASIGTSSTIMCGVKIGVNAIVGAGSVVIKDISKNTVVAGNPAKFMRYIQ